MLENAILMGADNSRTRAYIDLLSRNDLAPARAVLLAPNGPVRTQAAEPTDLFDNITPAATAAEAQGIDVLQLAASDINDDAVAACLTELDQKLVIFSGYGGAIIGRSLFDIGKVYLHMHPGHLPDYRGSTTIYHSLLDDGDIWVSAILMAPHIDAGPVVGRRRFAAPKDRGLIDTIIDPYFRALALTDVLSEYTKAGRFVEEPQETDDRFPCFIIHPVLKHVAILSQRTKIA